MHESKISRNKQLLIVFVSICLCSCWLVLQEANAEQLDAISPQLRKSLNLYAPNDVMKMDQQSVPSKSKIYSIVEQYQKKRISRSTAYSKLFPLVKKQMQKNVLLVENRIAELEQTISQLKQTKRNIDASVKQHVKQLLDGSSEFGGQQLLLDF
jgi:predicted phage-related endonuclease|tara:strand:- start:1339 stop:1800 length:462 start_codon:yes stop_codon:yes gene_type:complete